MKQNQQMNWEIESDISIQINGNLKKKFKKYFY